MSIINEALKKTEESIQRNSTKEPIEPDIKRNLKTYLLYFLIFIIGLFLSSLIFTSINRKVKISQIHEAPKAKTTLMPEKELKANEMLPAVAPATLSTGRQTTVPWPVASAMGSRTTALRPVALPEKQNKPVENFILNGIFYSDNDGYALVNNQIIRENDSIDGARVEKITANTVKLNNEGKIITLYTNR